jgi:hypothetical protein
MDPNKVYYWDEKQKESYYIIKRWIETVNPSEEITENGINALVNLVGISFDKSNILIAKESIDVEQQIIRVEIGNNIQLNGLNSKQIQNGIKRLRVHKIEFYGASSNKSSELIIGDKSCGTFHSGEFTYVTEFNNSFIESLPIHENNNYWDLNLINNVGEFSSTLHVRNLLSGMEFIFDNVISFAVIGNSYIYIDKSGKPIFMCSEGAQLSKFMLKHSQPAVYVKGCKDKAVILYDDCVLCSSFRERITNVVRAYFMPSQQLITEKIKD